jgi:ABC-type thiamin/hydroxymethylpyrimidine transport system permease subunit
MLSTRELSIIIILSSLGGTMSIIIGYAGSFLSPIGGQFLSGAHIFWLILATIMVKKRGSASFTGALKGLVEMVLFSRLGIFVFVLSFVEGVVVDIVFGFFGRFDRFTRYLAGGLSSASNILVLNFFFFLQVSIEILLLMYLVSFLSGLVFGGYLSNRVSKVVITGNNKAN